MTILLRHSIGLNNNARDVSRTWLKKKGYTKNILALPWVPFRLSKDILGLARMLTNMKGLGIGRGKYIVVSKNYDLYVSYDGNKRFY